MKRIKLIALTCILYFFVYTIQLVVVHKFVNPIVTPAMIIHVAKGVLGGKNSFKIKKRWVPLNEISRNAVYDVIAAEDYTFFRHHGFDWTAIKRAYKYNQTHKDKLLGGSTISQQTAKIVFLYPSRIWLRKGIEAYFTILIEMIWSKQRILEVYLNVMEMGDGVYGIESGAEVYFNVPASKLTVMQAASLAAILSSPCESFYKPDSFVKRKNARIERLMIRMKRSPWDFPLEY